MSIKIFCTVILLICCFEGHSQQDFRISHGDIADVYRNPAMVGSNSSLSVFVLHRRQWVSLQGAPNTSLIGASYNLSSKIGGAIGLQIVDDQIGNLKYNNVKLLYAKDFRIGITEIRFGISVIGNTLKPNQPNWVTSDLGNDDNLSNEKRLTAKYLDFGSGISVKRNDFTFGIASSRLRNIELKDVNWIASRSFNGWLGYKIQWGNKIAFNTSPMLRILTNESSLPQIEGRLDTEINNKFWLLAGYRLKESAILGFSFTLPVGVGKMIVGYVFDYSLNALAEYNSGSHELMLRFNLERIQVNEKKEIKNVRFL